MADEDDRKDAAEVGGTEWEGVPAGTSGSAAPGTQASGEEERPDMPDEQRPTRRGHEDVGDASGELGVVGRPDEDRGGQPGGAAR